MINKIINWACYHIFVSFPIPVWSFEPTGQIAQRAYKHANEYAVPSDFPTDHPPF